VLAAEGAGEVFFISIVTLSLLIIVSVVPAVASGPELWWQEVSIMAVLNARVNRRFIFIGFSVLDSGKIFAKFREVGIEFVL